MSIKKMIAVVLTVVCAVLSPMPTVKASAEESESFGYLISYKADCTVVTLTPTEEGNVLRYTTDGSDPTPQSSAYTKELKFKSAKTLKVKEYDKNGKALSKALSISVKRGCTPVTVSVDKDKKQKYHVTLTTDTKGAVIYYTTNGSTPKAGASKTKKYTGEFTVAEGKTVTAIAKKKGYNDSKPVSQTIGKKEKKAKTAEAPESEDISGNYDPIVRDVFELVNKERSKASLYAVALDERLCSAAQKRAEEIAADYSIGHNRPDGDKWYTVLSEYSYRFSYAGENLGFIGGPTYNDGNAASYIMDMWMNSPAHRPNVLNDSGTHIGIGMVRSGGHYYFVQIFSAEL